VPICNTCLQIGTNFSKDRVVTANIPIIFEIHEPGREWAALLFDLRVMN